MFWNGWLLFVTPHVSINFYVFLFVRQVFWEKSVQHIEVYFSREFEGKRVQNSLEIKKVASINDVQRWKINILWFLPESNVIYWENMRASEVS